MSVFPALARSANLPVCETDPEEATLSVGGTACAGMTSSSAWMMVSFIPTTSLRVSKWGNTHRNPHRYEFLSMSAFARTSSLCGPYRQLVRTGLLFERRHPPRSGR
ncbi:MAG: hypothetical protein [Circular genetic element sp.]|nr:MAG: hypothetical protein [Circular genetic element sp.]